MLAITEWLTIGLGGFCTGVVVGYVLHGLKQWIEPLVLQKRPPLQDD